MDQNRNYVERKFGHCEVLWEIENFCIIHDREYTIYSPDFYVRAAHLTKWKMFIKRKMPLEGASQNFFGLEKLTDTASTEILVDCKLHEISDEPSKLLTKFTKIYREDLPIESKINFFEYAPTYEVDPSGCLLKGVHDLRKFKCSILIVFKNVEETFHECSDSSIKQLSDRLHILFLTGYEYDLKFRATRVFKAHKSILYCRIKDWFVNKNISSTDTLSLGDMDSSAIHQVVHFLYTANMEHAVRSPRIAVYECAVEFDVRPIIVYYTPDILKLYSSTDVEEFDFTWTVDNFTGNEKSPIRMNETTETQWYLGFEEEYCILYAEGRKQICIRELEGVSELQDSNPFLILPGYRKDKFHVEYSKKGYEKGRITIRCKFALPTGSQSMSVGESITTCEPFSEELNYLQLSEDMKSLFAANEMCDLCISLRFQNEFAPEKELYVHKAILYARCPSFYKDLEEKKTGWLSESTICEVIYFLYCGDVYSCSLRQFYELYRVAVHYKLNTLKDRIASKLKQILAPLNAQSLREFAES